MPAPVSRTAIVATPSPACREIATWPPSGVNLIAFDRRFQTTCWRRAGSPTTGPTSSSRNRLIRMERDAASRCNGLDRVLHDSLQAHDLGVEAQLAGDDPADVQQVGDELGLHPRVARDDVEASIDDVGILAGIGHQLGPPEDGVQRRAQFVETIATNSSLIRLARSASALAVRSASSSRSRSAVALWRSNSLRRRSSAMAASAWRWAEMSRAIFDTPMMVPESSRTGETVSEMSMRRPSLARRSVSK